MTLPLLFTQFADILSRKHKSHAWIHLPLSSPWHSLLMWHFQDYLNSHRPMLSQQLQCHLISSPETESNSFINNNSEITLIFVSLDEAPIAQWEILLAKLLKRPHHRLCLLTTNAQQALPYYLNHHFTSFYLHALSENDHLQLLQAKSSELENSYHLAIPKESVKQAYHYAVRYLNPASPLDSALQLLDSAAAQSNLNQTISEQTPTPLVTQLQLNTLLSRWTGIPAAQLSPQKQRLAEYPDELRQRIIGQDIAIAAISPLFKNIESTLIKKSGPLATFLFAGPTGTGKKTVATTICDLRYGRTDLVYIARPPHAANSSLLDITLFQPQQKILLTLRKLIQTTPYAMIILDDIDLWPNSHLETLYQLFTQGQLLDNQHRYDFSQTIIIATTTLGSAYLTQQSTTKVDSTALQTEHMSLMHLLDIHTSVLTSSREKKHHSITISTVLDEIKTKLPLSLCQQFTVAPFFPLQLLHIKIIWQLAFNKISQRLHAQLGIHFSFANEVLDFLTHQVNTEREIKGSAAMQSAIDDIYHTVEHYLHTQQHKSHPSHLFLQLNETGQRLECNMLSD